MSYSTLQLHSAQRSQRSSRGLIAGLLFATLAALVPATALGQPAAAPQVPELAVIPSATPESVGLSSERLELLTSAFDKEIRNKQLPGAVVMVARHGKLVYAKAFGVRDPASAEPMKLNSIFRIYSMTKPLASVAAMQLVDDGLLQLSDPVAKWLPAFSSMKVVSGDSTVNALRAMTVQDLLRHTSGLVYGEINQNPLIKKALTDAGLYKPGVIDFDIRDLSPKEFSDRLATVPLATQPGSAWEYSLSTDLLGRVVEAVSGKRLGDFMEERVFKPVRMSDTAFHVSSDKMNRLAGSFDKDPAGPLPFRLIDVSKQPANDSGGAGAVSTATDFLQFTQMLLNGGTFDGKRVLSPATIKYMSADHLGTSIALAPGPGGGLLAATTYTFGLGFAVRPGTGLAPWPGSAGDYYWGGYAGTYFWIDPKEKITGVLMVQSPGAQRLYHRNLVRQLVYQAIVPNDDRTRLDRMVGRQSRTRQ